MPNYSVAEAARSLRLKPTTVYRWALGQPYQTRAGERRSSGVFALAQRKPPTLSFWNLVELYVLAGIRLQHGVSLQKVRRALAYVGEQLSVDRPLINQEFMTDGIDLFIEEMSRHSIINASSGRQAEIEQLCGRLRRIGRDPKGLAARIYPSWSRLDEPRTVELNPARSFGRLVIAGTNVPVEIIAERWHAGENIHELADDYHLTPKQIETAARWI